MAERVNTAETMNTAEPMNTADRSDVGTVGRRAGRVRGLAVALGLAVLATGCTPAAEPISAFFGLDDAIPSVLCPKAKGLDGMPVVLGTEIDATTLDPTDFEVVQASGAVNRADCATLVPSVDKGELRTVLLIGRLGSVDDPPATVRIVGNLGTIDGTGDYLGTEVKVVPLDAGPSPVLAVELTAEERAFSASQEPATSCVNDPANRVLRVTWDGGITLPDGTEPTDADLDRYVIGGTTPDDRLTVRRPVGFADLGDNDNVHELCFDGAVTPLTVTAIRGSFTDPRGDLNDVEAIFVTPS